MAIGGIEAFVNGMAASAVITIDDVGHSRNPVERPRVGRIERIVQTVAVHAKVALLTTHSVVAIVRTFHRLVDVEGDFWNLP